MNWKYIGAITIMLLLAWLFAALGGPRLGAGADWLRVLIGGALVLVLVTPIWRARRRLSARDHDAAAVGYLRYHSPRAGLERQWRRLGSPRGRLLNDVDKQTELSDAHYRLEYGRPGREHHSWLAPNDKAQAHDLQLWPGSHKRKGKPKRQRYG